MVDTALNVNSNTGHDYAECSNKGLCDRKSGQCDCLPGYDGVACQRASCPSSKKMGTISQETTNSYGNQRIPYRTASRISTSVQVDECSGHGTCETISEVSFLDNENVYELWDKESSMGCVCDPG